jgi:hypothetical protein
MRSHAAPDLDNTTTADSNGSSKLRQALKDAIAEAKADGVKLTMEKLTVLSPEKDPFRLDTPAKHRNSEWLADVALALGKLDSGKKIHLRGLHYATSNAKTPFIKPDGTQYLNNDADWEWMKAAMKSARWLGYIPWDVVKDKHSDAPTIYKFTEPDPWPYLSVGLDITVPSVDEIQVSAGLEGFEGVQPYKIIMIGEKSSLRDILLPIAWQYGADLYLPTGNISDTFVHQIAKNAHEDTRPLVLQYFSDCDPSGWNMPIEVGRKLQAFKATLFPDIEFRQYRAALTPEQVKGERLPDGTRLPESPLKPKEKRADRWMELMGVKQTEIDALIELHPNLLRRIARKAIAPFYDLTLDQRVFEARTAWVREAQRVVDNDLDDHLQQIRDDAVDKLEEMQAEIDAINEAMRFDLRDFDVPDIPEIPEPNTSHGVAPEPLIDSSWSFVEQCQALIDSKAYEGGDDQ